MSPVREGLRDRPERKPIITANYYAALGGTEALECDKDRVMVKVQLQGEKETGIINAMVDSGATEDFIDSEVCKKHGIKMIKAKNSREIYLADGKPRAMGPVTHLTEVRMDISNHREVATLQVANLQHDEVILRMPWVREHNPTIDWKEKKITINSERCTTFCLNSLPVVYAEAEAEALQENLITRLSEVQAKEDQSVKVKKLSAEARVPTEGSAKAAGHDLYASKGTEIPAGGQVMVGTRIAIQLPHITYWTFSRKEKKRHYPHTDQESTWESTWKKERQYQSKRSTHWATTRLRNYSGTSSKTNREDGSGGSRQDEHHLSCLSGKRMASSGSVWTTGH